MSPEEAIIKYGDLPLRDSVYPVMAAFAGESLIVGLSEPLPESSGDGQDIPLLVSKDKRGRHWVCAYTNEATFLDAFPNGSFAASTTVDALIEIVERNSLFEGIAINNVSDAPYILFRSMFEDAKRALKQGLPDAPPPC